MGTVISFVGREKRKNRAGLIWLVQCECGNTYEASTTELTCCRKKNCGCINTRHHPPKENNIGERYGSLVVIDIDGKKNTSGTLYRKCLCDCGKEKYVTLGNLKSGNVSSCGCLKMRQGKDHPLWRGHGGISKRYWSRTKRNAANRNIEFAITIEEMWQQWLMQEGKCKLTGEQLLLHTCKGNNTTASLDRIDSSRGYTKNNIQWVHKDIQKMKTDFNNEFFIKMCHKVAKRSQLNDRSTNNRTNEEKSLAQSEGNG